MSPGRSYQVVVSGHIGNTVAASLAPLTLRSQNGVTTISAISGEGFDAAMLSGVLRAIERLGLELVAVRSSLDDESDRT